MSVRTWVLPSRNHIEKPSMVVCMHSWSQHSGHSREWISGITDQWSIQPRKRPSPREGERLGSTWRMTLEVFLWYPYKHKVHVNTHTYMYPHTQMHQTHKETNRQTDRLTGRQTASSISSNCWQGLTVGKDVEGKGLLNIAYGNANQSGDYGNQFLGSSEKPRNRTAVWSCYATGGNIQEKWLHIHVYCDTIHNRQIMESALLSISRWMHEENKTDTDR